MPYYYPFAQKLKMKLFTTTKQIHIYPLIEQAFQVIHLYSVILTNIQNQCLVTNNSPYDEKSISLTIDGDNGFISSIRPGGFGKYDIYNITFLNEPVRRVVYLIDFLNPENNKHYENLKLDIYNEKDLLIGKYAPNENNGIFTIILEKGNYKIIGESNNEIVFEKIVKVSEFDIQNEIKTINFND